MSLFVFVLQACRVAPWNCSIMLTRSPCCWNDRHSPCSVEKLTSIISICPSSKVGCWIFLHVCYMYSKKQTLELTTSVTFLSERLTETLRMNPSPAVSAQMYLMFRVLLLRVSSQHLTSLWPIMVTELVRPHSIITGTTVCMYVSN